MMARMQMVYNMDFWKRDSLNVFQLSSSARKSLKFCRSIVAIQNSVKKCFLSFISSLSSSINLANIPYIYKRFILSKCTMAMLL